jgi:2-keto-3-deoxy-L-fuconate dehydrogenase
MNADVNRERRVVVTGGASGIGAATVELLRAAGAHVAVIDRDVESDADSATFRGDVSDWDSIRPAIDAAADSLGGIDAVVASAGVTARGTIEETEPEEWDRVFGVNVRGVYLTARAAMPHLRSGRNPAIVVVASQLGLVANGRNAAYCASKGAAIQLVRAMAIDAIPDGIRVNAVCPGATDTPMTTAHYADASDKQDQNAQLIGRWLKPVEIASMIVHLTSPVASASVGAIAVVDGGYTIH